jgi:hypothetical protein
MKPMKRKSMKRVMSILAGVVLLPAIAAAQAVPAAPLPPLPPVPPAPVVAPVPPMPPAPVVPPVPPMPTDVPFPVWPDSKELFKLQDKMFELQDKQFKFAEAEFKIAEKAAWAADFALANVNANVNLLDFQNDFKFPPFEFQGPGPVPVIGGRGRDGDERGMYNNGLNALQSRQYDRAILQFDRVIALKGTHADAATYWKAFSEARLVRTDDALATITALRRDYPQSRYLPEAKVLEADVRRLAGQRVDPQTLDANDELKLIAINGIANTDPDRAIPLLEGVLNGANTLGNKRRALFVLALSKDPRAHQILLRYAKGGGSPELQVEAIRNLVSRREGQTSDAELREIYESTQDPTIRRAVIEAYGNAGNKGALLVIAKSKTDVADNKRSALSRLQNLATPAELWSIYQVETDPELRIQIVNVFTSMGATTELMQIVKTEKDPKVRLRALRNLGNQNIGATGTLLVDLYGAEQERDAKRSIISALRGQNNAAALVAIARKETNLELKREIVSAISDMAARDKVAADYLTEMFK